MAGGQNVTIKAPKAASIRAMTSAYGRVIPLLYGKNRVQANVIYYTDFIAIENKSKKKTGGKGGGGSQTDVNYTYTVCVLFGLIDNEGGTCDLGTLWVGKDKGSASSFGLSFFNGGPTQTAMSYITTKHPTEALNYRGTAYVGASAFSLGTDASMPSINAEMIGRYSGQTVGSWTGGDTNPYYVIYDLVSSPTGLGLLSGVMGDFNQMIKYCQAAQIFVSPVYTEAKPAREMIANIARIANCGIYWSEGTLKCVSFCDVAITANGETYAPNLTPAYDINENDTTLDGDEPVRCVRKAQAEAYNYVKVTYQNRAKDYNDDVVEAKDQASIEKYGLRAMSEVSLPEIADTSVARIVAQNILQRAQNIRNVYEFRVNWRFARLEPMDIVTLTDSGLSLDHEMLRIIEVEEEDNGFRIKAEEMQIGAHFAARYSTQTSDGYVTDFNVAPGATTVQAIFEAPTELASSPQIWCAATPAVLGSTIWGGCNIWVSTDGSTYKQIGMMTGATRAGKIGSIGMNLMTGSGPTVPDTTSTCRADISYSNSSMDSGNAADAARYTTLCYANGEFFSYKTSTLVSAGVYDLTYLYRGLYGSIASAHGANSTPFVRIDDTLFKFDYSGLPDVGYTLYFKFQSFNVYGGGVEDLSTVAVQTLTLAGFVAPAVANLALDSQADDESIVIKWDAISTALYYEVDIRDATGVTSYKTVKCTDTRFIFLWQETANLSGGPYRSLRFYVRTYTSNGVSGYTYVSVSNPVPAALSGLNVTGGFGVIFYQWNKNVEKDLAGYQVWLSNTSGFTPGPTNLLVDTVDNGGNTRTWNNSGVVTALAQGSTYYFRAAAYDKYGKTGLNISSEFAATVQAIATGISPGEITSAMIAAGAVDMTKMATGIRPPRIVATLPTIDGTIYKNQDLVVLTTDGKLYRAVSGSWVKDVAAADVTGTLTNAQIADLAATKITGTLSDSQLAAISAAKVTGTLTDSQLAAISAAKITGTIVDAQLAAIAATKVTGTLTNAQIASLDAAKITSQIVSTQIANGSISTPKLAAGAVTANEIAANAVTANKIFVQSIGSALNVNPPCSDVTAWAVGDGGTFSVVNVTDGYGSTTALQNSGVVGANIRSLAPVQLSAGKTYRVSVLARRTAGSTTSDFWLRLYCYDGTITYATAGTPAGYLADSVGVEGATITGSWVRYSGTITPPANTSWGLISCYMSWGTACTVQIQDFRCEEMLPATLIQDGAIITSKVAANAITATQLAANSVIAGKIAAGVITSTEIAADTITAGNIAANAITSSELNAGSVVAGKIAAGAVTAGTIAANAVTATEIAAGSITTAKLVAGAVTANEIAANAVTATQLNAGAVTTAKLAAGAVTANEIAANTITAAKIAAGAIGATQIAANAITADKLYVQVNGTALNTNPTCNDPTAWVNTGSGYSLVTVSDGVNGTGAIRSTTARNTNWPDSTNFPITAGKTYRVQAWARGVNASPGNLYLRCLRMNSGGTDVSSSGSVGLENFAVTGSWVQYTGTFVAEATAVQARLEAPMNWGGTANTAYIEIQDFRCEEFIPGTLIMDGAITTNKVAANAITAGKIAANTITSNEIAANTITAGNIAANAITATQIASGSVTTSKLAAGAVTANEIAASTITTDRIFVGAATASAAFFNTHGTTSPSGSVWSRTDTMGSFTSTGAKVTIDTSIFVICYGLTSVTFGQITTYLVVDGVDKTASVMYDSSGAYSEAGLGLTIRFCIPLIYQEAFSSGSHSYAVKVQVTLSGSSTGSFVVGTSSVMQENKV